MERTIWPTPFRLKSVLPQSEAPFCRFCLVFAENSDSLHFASCPESGGGFLTPFSDFQNPAPMTWGGGGVGRIKAPNPGPVLQVQRPLCAGGLKELSKPLENFEPQGKPLNPAEVPERGGRRLRHGPFETGFRTSLKWAADVCISSVTQPVL